MKSPLKKRKARDVARAEVLRARDIFDLYGIAPSTLCTLARHPDPDVRPPSRLIRPTRGRRGVRLFPRAAFEAWLARWDHTGACKPAAA